MGGEPNEAEKILIHFRKEIEVLRNIANEFNNMNASQEDVENHLGNLNILFKRYKDKVQDDNDMYRSSMETGETHGY